MEARQVVRAWKAVIQAAQVEWEGFVVFPEEWVAFVAVVAQLGVVAAVAKVSSYGV